MSRNTHHNPRARVRQLLLAIFVLLAGFTNRAHAQAPAPPPPPPETEGSAEFAFVGTAGNSSTQTIGLGGELIFRPSPWETKLKASYVRNEANDQLTAQAIVLSFRTQRAINSRLSAYGQYGYQRDRFAGILNRNAVEGGLAYTWIEQAPQKLIVDAGLGYANERRLLGDNLSTGTFGSGGVYTLKLSSTSELSQDGHFVFSLSDSNDWRYANALALTAKVTTVFSLKLSNIVRYVHLPVVGFKTTDTVTSIALVAKF
jgi:putative salt-induced outer membrane protein